MFLNKERQAPKSPRKKKKKKWHKVQFCSAVQIKYTAEGHLHHQHHHPGTSANLIYCKNEKLELDTGDS